jgi:hypothetical protein
VGGALPVAGEHVPVAAPGLRVEVEALDLVLPTLATRVAEHLGGDPLRLLCDEALQLGAVTLLLVGVVL